MILQPVTVHSETAEAGDRQNEQDRRIGRVPQAPATNCECVEDQGCSEGEQDRGQCLVDRKEID